MKVLLTLDLATNTGFSLWKVGSKPELGSHNLAWCWDSMGKFLHYHEKWLRKIIEDNSVEYLCFEAPILVRHGKKTTSIEVAKKLLSLACLTEKVCWELDVRCASVEVSQWRKHFLGAGNYPTLQAKKMAVERCRAAGLDPAVHDEAEAFGILDYIATIMELKKDWRDAGLLGLMR